MTTPFARGLGRFAAPVLVLTLSAGAAEPPVGWTTPGELDVIGSTRTTSIPVNPAAGDPAAQSQPDALRDFRLFGEFAGSSTISVGEPGAGVLTRITNANDGADFDPQISREGSFLVFASTQHRETADLYLRQTNGSVLTQLTNHPGDDVMPSISPDGRRIAFTSNRAGNWDLYIMPASGGRAIQVTSGSEHEIHPSWSPDGTQLVFSRFGQTSGRWEMWVLEADNPSTSHFLGYGLFPEWNPVSGTGFAGGDRIVFQRSRERGDREFSIWCVEYRDGMTGNLSEIATSPSAALINPTWSPDGEHVVFASVPREQTDALAHLWLIGIDGSGRIGLTNGTTSDLMPAWGSNGQVYFVSNRGGRDDLWSLDIGEVIRTAQGESPFGMNNNSFTMDQAPAPSAANNPLANAFNSNTPGLESNTTNTSPALGAFRPAPAQGDGTLANVNPDG